LQPASPAWSPSATPPNNGFFEAPNYQGAFGDVNWAADWTMLAAFEILSTAGAGNPLRVAFSGNPSAPVLSIAIANDMAEIRFASEAGVSYQLQSAAQAAQPASWSNDGAPVAGTGGILTLTRPVAGQQYFQVIAQ
jgi:hypothetical protein